MPKFTLASPLIAYILTRIWVVPPTSRTTMSRIPNLVRGLMCLIVLASATAANWETDSDNRWTVPFGGGVGKIFNIGKQPVNGQVSAYYNVEKPRFGADWQLRLQLQFLFPK